MDSAISVKNVKKYYQVHKKEPGLIGSVRSLFHRTYFDVKAVDDISFDIEKAELVGFIGPNGAGKTTTLKMLSGLLHPTAGGVRVLGFDPFKREAAFQKQFSLVMGQKNQLWWDLPAYETFILNKEIYQIPEVEFKQTVDDLAKMLDIVDVLKVQVRKLSLGQRMKAELVAALLHKPKVLFLDEPTIGLDVVAQKNMRDFIKEYNQKYDATVILTSHYMGDVQELCKRVIIIDKGVILYDGLLAEVVEKYAPFKIIELDLEHEVPAEKLAEIGEIEEYKDLHAKIQVSRSEAPQRSAQLLNNFPITDIKIEEVAIEDIIRQVFNKE